MTRKDYVPDSAKNLRDWATNYHDKATAQLAGLTGWDAARVTALKAQIAPVRDAAQAVVDAQQALDDTLGNLAKSRTDHLPAIRGESTSIKTSPGYDEGIGDVLGIVATGGGFDPATYKAAGTAESLPGRVRLSTKKRGVDSMNIYMRRKGEPAFRLLMAKRVGFPVDDDTPPAVPGQSEVREYQLRGVIGDEEIGQPSDIIPATFTP